MRILLVVEGYGDVQAAKSLVRRVLQDNGYYEIELIVHRRGDLNTLSGNGWLKFRTFLEAAYMESCCILWMADCDDGCAIDWLQHLYEQAVGVGIRQPLAFCLWIREYEVLFLYDWESVMRKLGAEECEFENPETIRGVKEAITSRLPIGKIYRETIDQDNLSNIVDLDKLRANRSFVHFEKTLMWLISQNSPAIYPLVGCR